MRAALRKTFYPLMKYPFITLALVWHASSGLAQVPTNGSFENGLTGWTLGGASRVDSLTMPDLNNQITPTDGSRMAFLSTGPGNVGGPSFNVDGNGLNDFNITTLSTTLNFNVFPAVLKFDWSFPSSEQDQPFNFDDIFDVLLDGARVHSGSSNKPGGASPFPDAPASNLPAFNVGGGGVTAGSNLRFGVPAFSSLCIPITTAIPGDNAIPLQFRVADQTDTMFESGLVLDNVRVDINCGTPGNIAFRQMTLSVDQQLEVKDGDLLVRFAQNRNPVVNSDGAQLVFIANGDFGGGNPNLLEQVFLMEAGTITRLTNFTGDEIQAVEISEDGDFVVFSARATPLDNLEIFLLRLSNGLLTQITNTNGCDNTVPSVNNNGRRIAFLSTCGADLGAGFNADGNREMVFWNNGAFILNETSACQSFRPMVIALNNGSLTAFASDCNYSGTNNDGNLEVFLFNRNNNTFQQITNTTGASAVLDPVDINRNGDFIAYIAQDIGGRYVVYRYDTNTMTSTFQGVSRPDRLIFNVRILDTNNGDHIFYEALDLFAIPPTPAGVLGHIDVNTQIVTEANAIENINGIAGALVAGFPHIYFSATNDLAGMNADTNVEVFEGRVE